MSMNERKICFISCVTDESQYKQCLACIDQLLIPDGFEVDKIAIRDAKSMTEGYNRAMNESDAKYKIYLHQDTFIISKSFIKDILDLFIKQPSIGMMGVCGAKKLPTNGIWWEAQQRFGKVIGSHTGVLKPLEFEPVKDSFEPVEALDGLILMTQYDIGWREDIFDGFHFYDISQSLEFIQAGHLVVVIKQNDMMVKHDCCVKPDWEDDYEYYRERFLVEYSQIINPERKKEAKKFIFYFLGFDDVHFTKDIGILPYVMKKYYNYDSEIIVTREIESSYPSNERYTENMKVIFAESEAKIDEIIATADVLMLCGLYNFNKSIILRYKAVNPTGKIYLKLDLNINWLMNLDKVVDNEFIETFKQCDLISIESRRLQSIINSRWGFDTVWIPNGFYDFFESNFVDFTAKSNVILTVGRLGSHQKHSDLLFNTFLKIHNQIPEWNLVMVGNIEPWFQTYYDEIIATVPQIKDRVTLTGPLSYEETKKQYDEAKIFCLTSRWEGCANVLAESLGRGCYVISTDVDSSIDVLEYGEYGALVPSMESKLFQKRLLHVCQNETLMRETCEKVQQYSRNELNWIKLCGKLDQLLKDE